MKVFDVEIIVLTWKYRKIHSTHLVVFHQEPKKFAYNKTQFLPFLRSMNSALIYHSLEFRRLCLTLFRSWQYCAISSASPVFLAIRLTASLQAIWFKISWVSNGTGRLLISRFLTIGVCLSNILWIKEFSSSSIPSTVGWFFISYRWVWYTSARKAHSSSFLKSLYLINFSFGLGTCKDKIQ